MTQPKPKVRLFVPEPYEAGKLIRLDEKQSHYLAHVMRLRAGDAVAIFNGRDGEWLADIAVVEKKHVTLEAKARLKEQAASPDLWLCFAPIKNKTELVVEKAVELGVSQIIAVFTHHTVVRSVNLEKLQAHATEAAEQCERLDVPSIETAKDLAHMLGAWPKDRTLLFADESGGGAPLKTLLPSLAPGKYAVLVGPEGGFSAEERHMLKVLPMVKGFSLGPRILRADTAAVAALACVQAWRGDWEQQPAFKAT